MCPAHSRTSSALLRGEAGRDPYDLLASWAATDRHQVRDRS
ncbi:hypothetical protein AB0F72_35250 [Actinoplanes sp. NPDC023936]